jgi:hypothetical protein
MTRLPEGPLVEPPPLGADKQTLIDHYREVIGLGGCMSYEERRWRCNWCLDQGREVPEIGAGRGSVPKFCRQECAEGWAEYGRLVYGVTKPGKSTLEKVEVPDAETTEGGEGRPDGEGQGEPSAAQPDTSG